MVSTRQLVAAYLALLCAGLAAAEDWVMLWNDEFDAGFDRSKWTPDVGTGCQYLSQGWPMCGWGNGEMEYYSPNNALVYNDLLHIVARQEADNVTLTSARLYSTFAAAPNDTYRIIKVGIRIKFPRGPGLWPCVWMLPKWNDSCMGCGKYGRWAQSGEIDIVETSNMMDNVFAALHFGMPWPNDDALYTKLPEDPATPFTDFHIYELQWEKETMRWYFDGKQFATYSSNKGYLPPPTEKTKGWYSMGEVMGTPAVGAGPDSPFDQPFFLIINLALGGMLTNYTTGDVVKKTLATKPEVQVDWVRIQGLKG